MSSPEICVFGDGVVGRRVCNELAAAGATFERVVVPGLEGPDKGLGSDYVPGARARAIDAARS